MINLIKITMKLCFLPNQTKKMSRPRSSNLSTSNLSTYSSGNLSSYQSLIRRHPIASTVQPHFHKYCFHSHTFFSPNGHQSSPCKNFKITFSNFSRFNQLERNQNFQEISSQIAKYCQKSKNFDQISWKNTKLWSKLKIFEKKVSQAHQNIAAAVDRDAYIKQHEFSKKMTQCDNWKKIEKCFQSTIFSSNDDFW